eukprot:8976815-Ditylum_brightwellii.AAC.1
MTSCDRGIVLSGSVPMISRNQIRRQRRRRSDIEIHTLSSNAVSIPYHRYRRDYDSIDSID